MKHYKIVTRVKLPYSQNEDLRAFLSDVDRKRFNSLGLALSYSKRVENKIGQCYRNYYKRYYCHGRDIFIREVLLVGRMDGQDIALIGIQEVES